MLDAYCEPRPNGGVGVGIHLSPTLSDIAKGLRKLNLLSVVDV